MSRIDFVTGAPEMLKVARTIADLDADDTVRQPHIAEALRYRPAIAAAPPAA